MDSHGKTENTFSQKRRNDWILFAVLLAAAALGLLLCALLGKQGSVVTVTVDGELYGKYSLMESRQVEIPSGEHGEGRNLLVIENGEVSVTEASCPDGICVHHRPVSREGETIICLPNRVVITVRERWE